MRIRVTESKIVEGTRSDWTKTDCQVVYYKAGNELWKLTFVDVPEEDRDLVMKKNVEEAKKEIRKAIKNDWKDHVLEIEI